MFKKPPRNGRLDGQTQSQLELQGMRHVELTPTRSRNAAGR